MLKNNKIQAQTLKIPRTITITAKFLEVISPKLATLFAARLFTTPIKHKIPKREFHMVAQSVQETIMIPAIKKEIVIYKYGKGTKKILLVHGWSGRGTQLVKIADELVKLGYQTLSFDAPAHGKSKGKTSIMIEFIASILELEKRFGPFEYAIGHSLGGMSILNALKQNLNVKKAVVIGSGDIIQDIIDEFIKKINVKPEIAIRLKEHFENKFGEKMDSYSASYVAATIKTPVLLIHDTEDDDVNVKAAYHIHKNLKNSELMITSGLGHRKILGNNNVIKQIVEYLTK